MTPGPHYGTSELKDGIWHLMYIETMVEDPGKQPCSSCKGVV